MSESVSLRRLAACALAAALILFVPTGAGFTSAIRFTAFVGLLMALLWMTEAIPLGLTALIPLVAFPVAGIATTERIAAPYANPAVVDLLRGLQKTAKFARR